VRDRAYDRTSVHQRIGARAEREERSMTTIQRDATMHGEGVMKRPGTKQWAAALVGLSLLTVVASACSTVAGAAIGAGSGAAIGAGVDGGRGAKKGALIGTGVGAVAGTLYGISR